MKLRTKTSHINRLPEGVAPKKIVPQVIKIVYYLLLLAIVGGVLWVLAMRYIYFSGRGQVIVEKVKISSNWDGTVTTVKKHPEERFVLGEPLATLDLGEDCSEEPPQDIRLTRLKYDLRSKEAEYETLMGHKVINHELESEAILPRALEIGDADSRRRSERIQREAQALSNKIELLAAEIAVKKEELEAIRQQIKGIPQNLCRIMEIRADFEGKITNLFHTEGEYIRRGEALFVTIPKSSQIIIEAYFDKIYLSHIGLGDIMEVSFPDQYRSIGKVIDFSSAAGHFTERSWKDYVPVESKIRVHLQATSVDDDLRWRMYDRMDVKIRGKRK